jgi:glucosamine-6-phosphate deaminase
MKLSIAENYGKLSALCSSIVLETVRNKPDAVLCLPTGNTPIGLYKQLIGSNADPEFWSQVRIICLDEYFGIEPSDHRSFYRWLSKQFLDPLGIPHSHVYRFDNTIAVPEKVCMDFERSIAALGNIDLCILGLGLNGHLGFNEPGTDPDSKTHCVQLARETLVANSAYWGVDVQNVPEYGLTLGLGNILESKEIVVLVSGTQKAAILKKVIEGSETPEIPASYLKRSERVTIVADDDAAALLHKI